MPQQVADTAADLYNLFFRGWGSGGTGQGSLFTHAGPIWQELHVGLCANGTVVSKQAATDPSDTPQYGLVYQSFMPNLYLYLDGKMIDQTGAASTVPVQVGDFSRFSSIPIAGSGSPSAYGVCDAATDGNAGNPWGIGLPIPGVSENANPKSGIFCDDGSAFVDTGTL